jgi:nucleoside-diphosphate-sugar epimerase
MQMWYAMAKTVVEKEAHAFAKERGLDLVVINPSFVIGPMLTPKPTSTISMVLHFITTGTTHLILSLTHLDRFQCQKETMKV